MLSTAATMGSIGAPYQIHIALELLGFWPPSIKGLIIRINDIINSYHMVIEVVSQLS